MYKKNISPSVWGKILRDFDFATKAKKYKRVDYRTIWTKIAKPIRNVYIEVKENDVSVVIDDNHRNEIILALNDGALGEFLYDTFLFKEERNMVNYSTTKVNGNVASRDAAIAALETKADYCDGLTATSASVGNTTKTIDLDLNKVLSIDGDVAINGSLYTKTTADDWSASTTVTKANTVNSLGYDSVSSWVNVDLSTRPTFNDVEKMITDKINENNEKKEKKEMKGFNFDFGPCTGDQIRMSMYGLAVKNASGTYVSYNPKSGEIVDVDVLNFDGAKFMYKIPVAIKEIAVGDIIVHNRKPMFVIALPTGGTTALTCVDVCAGEQKQVIPTVNMFGFNFVTKIVSLFNTVGDNAPTPDAPFGNMLPFMLMNEGETIDPMMMMLMMGGKMDMSNPMMMYFMLKDNKNSDLLPLMFMMQNK